MGVEMQHVQRAMAGGGGPQERQGHGVIPAEGQHRTALGRLGGCRLDGPPARQLGVSEVHQAFGRQHVGPARGVAVAGAGEEPLAHGARPTGRAPGTGGALIPGQAQQDDGISHRALPVRASADGCG